MTEKTSTQQASHIISPKTEGAGVHFDESNIIS